MSTISQKLAKNRVVNIRIEVDQWKISHDEANKARDVDDFVAAMLSATEDVSTSVLEPNPAIFSGAGAVDISLAYAGLRLLDLTIEVLTEVTKIARSSQRRGFEVERFDELTERLDNLKISRHGYARGWLLADHDQLRDSMNLIAEGKFEIIKCA